MIPIPCIKRRPRHKPSQLPQRLSPCRRTNHHASSVGNPPTQASSRRHSERQTAPRTVSTPFLHPKSPS
jgi:hypothetical protein